ncbi:MAG TPA: DUF4157 domain-containing protein [Pseudonocardiaceae bacterium]|jgi:hypothetical protein|nr:DUF4157 domain-containing protein [Pseudonocardiaceae bacterium]
MRSYGHEHEPEVESRPRGDRIEVADTDALGRAAAAGRTDVLGASGMLGLQRIAGNTAVSGLAKEEPSPVHAVVGSGGGQALAPHTRAEMEARFGQSFTDVRVHTGEAAHDSARSVNALAYTVGSNIVFQSGRYDPESSSGRHTLAHELAHVVQQRTGPVEGTELGGGVQVSDPGDRFERAAVATADQVMSGSAPASAGAPAGVQRCAEEGVESVQREAEEPEQTETGTQTEVQTFVQREEEDEPAAE